MWGFRSTTLSNFLVVSKLFMITKTTHRYGIIGEMKMKNSANRPGEEKLNISDLCEL